MFGKSKSRIFSVMQSVTEKKFVLYVSIFIGILLNSYKLIALRDDGFFSQLWRFNGGELLFETAWNFIFCIGISYLNLYLLAYPLNKLKKVPLFIVCNLLLLWAFNFSGVGIQQKIFDNHIPDRIFRAGYLMRLLVSVMLSVITINIVLLLRKNKQKNKENEALKTAYLNAQLDLLKEELNPHFFFNALSSLSSVITENPKLAQTYISHLSKIYRYTLSPQNRNLVTLKDELAIFDSYAALQKIRLEEKVEIVSEITVDNWQKKLPYMSLQPVLENALKHNAATREKPLQIKLWATDEFVFVQNTLQPVVFKEASTGIGLSNLNERCKILLKREIEIVKTETHFTIKIPLQPA